MVNQNEAPLAIVTGVCEPIGTAIAVALVSGGWTVLGWGDDPEFVAPDALKDAKSFHYRHVPIQWPDDIADALIRIPEDLGIEGDELDGIVVDALINCSSLRFTKPFPKFDFGAWENVMDVNAKAIALLARISLSVMENTDPLKAGTILNIVGHQTPTAGNLALHASKGAALAITKQLALELSQNHGLTIFSISPGEGAKDELLAEFVAFLLSAKARHIAFNGCDIPYGA